MAEYRYKQKYPEAFRGAEKQLTIYRTEHFEDIGDCLQFEMTDVNGITRSVQVPTSQSPAIISTLLDIGGIPEAELKKLKEKIEEKIK